LLGVSAGGLAIYTALNLALLPSAGFVGSAIATAGSLGFVTVGGMLILARMGVWPNVRTLQILLPAAVLSLGLPLLSGSPFVQLLIATPLTLAALAVLWRFPSLASSRAEQVALTREALGRTS
jgi:hypothetical protein